MREVLKRGSLGALCGVAGVYLLSLLLSALSGGGAYLPVTGGLAAASGGEVSALGVQMLASGLFGAAVCAGTLFWSREGGSFWSNSLWNYLLDCGAFLLWAWTLLGWPGRWETVGLLFALYTLLYAIGWLIRAISLRDTVYKINEVLAGPRDYIRLRPRWKLWESCPYWVLEMLVFGLLPLALGPFDAADVPVLRALVLPFLVFPFTALISGFSLGRRYGFCPIFPLLTLLEAPTAAFHYRDWSYGLILALTYGVLALAGNGLGTLCRRRKTKGCKTGEDSL